MILIKFLFLSFFIFLLFVVLMGFSLIRGAKRMFGGGRDKQQQAYGQRRASTYANKDNQRNAKSSGQSSYAETNGEPRYSHRKKVYAHDEGEYVDYEEVKD